MKNTSQHSILPKYSVLVAWLASVVPEISLVCEYTGDWKGFYWDWPATYETQKCADEAMKGIDPCDREDSISLGSFGSMVEDIEWVSFKLCPIKYTPRLNNR